MGPSCLFATHVFSAESFQEIYLSYSEVTIEKTVWGPTQLQVSSIKVLNMKLRLQLWKTYMSAKHHGLYQFLFATYFLIPFKGIWPWEGPMWPEQNLCPKTQLTKNLQEYGWKKSGSCTSWRREFILPFKWFIYVLHVFNIHNFQAVQDVFHQKHGVLNDGHHHLMFKSSGSMVQGAHEKAIFKALPCSKIILSTSLEHPNTWKSNF